MIYLLLGGLGLLIGALGRQHLGWLFGLALGLTIAEITILRERLSALEKRRKAETPEADKVAAAHPSEDTHPVHPVQQPPVAVRDVSKKIGVDREGQKPIFDLPGAVETSTATVEEVGAPAGKSVGGGHEWATEITQLVGKHLKLFFTTNLVTKIGVTVLFFGFAFLLKYAVQRNLLSIELRLIGVTLVGLGLLGTGWRIRRSKPIYALLLQGCGVGILYLTVYAAARFYELLPYGVSFALMLILVVFSGFLAVLQNARSLALTGIIGGFLAPLLMSTGTGSHVVLFSYYALLNLGIVGIAWRRAWRELNIVGFFFTFGIASFWGGQYYRPYYFATTEPFLILFFLFYVAISLLHALNQPTYLKGYVDGTLVFGVPIVAFGLQYGLVRNFEYGLAVSALVLGLFYILFATVLWRRRIEVLRMLTESFLSFGIVFCTLAIPLALNNRWTSAAWALEGCAILWVGIRQRRVLARISGVLLQAGAGISFLLATNFPFRKIFLINDFYIGCLLVSFAGLFSSWYVMKKEKFLYNWERYTQIPLMVWGLVWWFGAGISEINQFVSWRDEVSAVLTYVALSFLFTDILSRRLSWKQFSLPALFLLPTAVISSFSFLGESTIGHLFARFGFPAWALVFGVQYRLLYKCENKWPKNLLLFWHQLTLWLLIFVLARESAYFVDRLLPGKNAWQYFAWGVVPCAILLFLLSRGDLIAWPVRRFHDAYLNGGAVVPVVILFVSSLIVNFYHGDPSPLPYIPLFNPVEITQLFILLVALKWVVSQEAWLRKLEFGQGGMELKMTVYGAGFLLLNAMVARTIHFWTGVPYNATDLYNSVLFEASLSIIWGVTALVVALVASRKGSRVAWIWGATILSLVVAKLFLVDLAGTGTISRIVSFIGVGSLMLLIGYFSPLPPQGVNIRKSCKCSRCGKEYYIGWRWANEEFCPTCFGKNHE